MPTEVSVERAVAASPERLYEMVADVTRMGEWSPETASCEWIGGATGPLVGARFKGRNEREGKRWSTVSTVVEATPGRSFAFEVKAGPLRVARWGYRFEPVGGGCRVTETWTDQRGWFVTKAGAVVSGVKDRAAHNRTSMEQTLDRLAAAAAAEA